MHVVSENSGTGEVRVLTEDDYNKLAILLEQIEGCADLILSHLDLAADKGAMTAVNVIKEKARAAFQIINDLPLVG